ncbi:hypothetical protein THF1D04_280031 [Vibrio owensii]|uniref:DUF3108 domain-containing protein n=1 Tax=Vibrio owensii TaxID=696485 RepID=A0AAU9Q695_9VIBR|nr:hypothetical protein THF1D04_280031 [Vibrio owensii]
MKKIRNTTLTILFSLLLWPLVYSVSYNDRLVYRHTIANNEYKGIVSISNGRFELIYRVKNHSGKLTGVYRMKGILLRFLPHKVLVYTTNFRPVVSSHFDKSIWISNYWIKRFVPVTLKDTRLSYYSVGVHRYIESYVQCRGDACPII